jgi:hypothetical protein
VTLRHVSTCVILLLAACGTSAEPSSSSGSSGATPAAEAGVSSSSSSSGIVGPGLGSDGGTIPSDASVACDSPLAPAGAGATLDAAFAPLYKAYELGAVPGVPDHLGGCVVKSDDKNTMLFVGASESQIGAIYSIKLKRDACGHIVGFGDAAVKVADTPYVDANLVYAPGNVIFYTGWPVGEFSQLLPGATAPAQTVSLKSMGMPDSAGGLGFVPPPLGGQGGLRTVSWPNGDWYHLGYKLGAAPLFTIGPLEKKVTLPGGPGGFAYVPSGSPGFPKQSVVVSEWSADKVATYEVDDAGDPIVASRRELFSAFPKPWGAYFEPETGDFVFLTWGSPPDKVFVVQGFTKPPPPPSSPPK